MRKKKRYIPECEEEKWKWSQNGVPKEGEYRSGTQE
jgi:hypothetical protein